MTTATRHLQQYCASLALIVAALAWSGPLSSAGQSQESLIIAASPSMKTVVEALSRAFEKTHPNVSVKVSYDSGLEIRQTIAALENNGRFFIGTGPIHLVAPGGDELIRRLETKYYVLPGTKQAYAAVPLALVVPATLVEAPGSFEELGRGHYRIAMADPTLTELGRQTQELLGSLGIADNVQGRLDIASDARGVLDHLLLGQADVGIVFGPEAVKEQERIRTVAVAGRPGFTPTVHSMAMERYCPDRVLCRDFLEFLQSPEAQRVVESLGYVRPSGR